MSGTGFIVSGSMALNSAIFRADLPSKVPTDLLNASTVWFSRWRTKPYVFHKGDGRSCISVLKDLLGVLAELPFLPAVHPRA